MKSVIYALRAPVRMTIALLTDLHNRPARRVIDSLAAHRPDVICVAGDLISGYAPEGDEAVVRSQRHILPFLSECRKLAPTFVSLGNHDCLLSEDDLKLIRQTGVTLLDDDWCDSCGVVIGGLSSGRVPQYRSFRAGKRERYPQRDRSWFRTPAKPNLDWLDGFERRSGYHILLSHHPEYRDAFLDGRRIDLVLSGHAHGGQIRLFSRGLYAPGQGFLAKYVRGVHRGAHGCMVISAGLSNTVRLIPRLFNPREVVYIRLGDGD